MEKCEASMVGMSNSGSKRCRLQCTARALALTAVFVLGASSAPAQTVKISTRPLTTGEIKLYGLTNTTQLAAGVANVGIGQPAYLEALVTKGTVVTQVTWSLPTRPTGSSAVLQPSPLGTNVPSYDSGDRQTFDIAGGTNGRAMLVPDVVGSTLKGDYTVVARVMLTNKTITVTNMIYGSKYQGMYGEDGFGCELCHSDKIPAFTQTAHSDALKRKINGEAGAGFKSTCISCHALGYDATPAAVNGGFDDVALQTGWQFPTNLASPSATNNWDAMPAALQAKSNIQCENCHGPGYRHMLGGASTNMVGRGIGISLSAGNCGQCHDAMTHHVKNYEWGQTLHAVGSLHTSSSCLPCHTSPGFIDANDPGIDFDGNVVVTRGTRNEGITCAACHDPHSKGRGDNQLRNITNVTFATGGVITKGGDGLVCMKCHHDRGDANTTWQKFERGSPGAPHHGVQGDILFGTNAIQYGMSMPSSRHWDVVENTCVTCHMQETPAGMNTNALNHVGGHTFMIGWSSGTNTVHLTEACAGCHGELESFNFGGEDYDQDGTVEGVQKEISDMMFQLAKLLPPYSGTNIDTTGWPTNTAVDFSRRAARYNWLLVKEDGSLGVHNPKYTAAILRASIDDLRGGIDVDHDGLPDAWEIAIFGDLTSQSGSSDYDGDGLSNAQEMALGTNPKDRDSDHDGIWDGAELQAGSDPLNATSHPGTNAVTFLPAFELGYFPATNGVTLQFQSIDTLQVPSGWTNIGPSYVTSNAWFYQLISPRDAEKRFFRALTTP